MAQAGCGLHCVCVTRIPLHIASPVHQQLATATHTATRMHGARQGFVIEACMPARGRGERERKTHRKQLDSRLQTAWTACSDGKEGESESRETKKYLVSLGHMPCAARARRQGTREVLSVCASPLSLSSSSKSVVQSWLSLAKSSPSFRSSHLLPSPTSPTSSSYVVLVSVAHSPPLPAHQAPCRGPHRETFACRRREAVCARDLASSSLSQLLCLLFFAFFFVNEGRRTCPFITKDMMQEQQTKKKGMREKSREIGRLRGGGSSESVTGTERERET